MLNERARALPTAREMENGEWRMGKSQERLSTNYANVTNLRAKIKGSLPRVCPLGYGFMGL